MSIVGFNHFNLRGPRELIEKLREFYCGLGLEQGQRPPFESFGYWLYANSNECVLHLSEAAPEEARSTHTVTTFDHVAFTCTDRPKTEALLKRNNIGFRTATVPALGITQLFLQDPAGNGIELSFKE